MASSPQVRGGPQLYGRRLVPTGSRSKDGLARPSFSLQPEAGEADTWSAPSHSFRWLVRLGPSFAHPSDRSLGLRNRLKGSDSPPLLFKGGQLSLGRDPIPGTVAAVDQNPRDWCRGTLWVPPARRSLCGRVSEPRARLAPPSYTAACATPDRDLRAPRAPQLEAGSGEGLA